MSYKETVLRTPGSPFPGADILKISKHVQWGGVNRPNGFQILYRLLDKIDKDVTKKRIHWWTGRILTYLCFKYLA